MTPIPTKTVQPYRRRRHIPDRPPGGYHVTTLPDPEQAPEPVDHAELIRAALADLATLDAQMIPLEVRADRLADKLADPAITIPADDPRRLDAEDRLDQMHAALSSTRWQVGQIASVIHTLGASIDDDQLAEIGRTLVRDMGALGRVQTDAPGLLTGRTWQILFRESCPF